MAVLGVGVNDADYSVGRYVAGRQVLCPFYRVWADMIRRCYDEKYIRKYPSYKNAVVCDEWLDSFMAFKSWMEKTRLAGETPGQRCIRARTKSIFACNLRFCIRQHKPNRRHTKQTLHCPT